jgi:hypothetical protein
MNAICRYCGEPQHYSVAWMDTVVPCGHCGREFLLCNRPRDELPSSAWSPMAFRNVLSFLGRVIFVPLKLLSGRW